MTGGLWAESKLARLLYLHTRRIKKNMLFFLMVWWSGFFPFLRRKALCNATNADSSLLMPPAAIGFSLAPTQLLIEIV